MFVSDALTDLVIIFKGHRLQKAFKLNVFLNTPFRSKGGFCEPTTGHSVAAPPAPFCTSPRLRFLFCKELIFICDNKCSLLGYQHTLPFSFTISDVAKIGFLVQNGVVDDFSVVAH